MTTTFDLHDQAYYLWRQAGARREVLVHVDAHHDAAHVPSWGAIDIGNYVRAAIRAQMVAEIRWVVPDPMWRDETSRRVLLDEFAHISSAGLRNDSTGAASEIEGVECWMGPLAGMPAVPPGVLLDIDVDFLLTARFEDGRSADPLSVPWCWPEELVSRLGASGIQAKLITVATSVTGGFTPLRWAHLAREIASRLDGSSSPAMLACFGLLRDAARAASAAGALETCRAAVAACPDEAAALFHLAGMLQAAKELDAARSAYRRARELDPSYAHPFRTAGPVLLRRHRLVEAEAAYRDGLALDPDDPDARLGLAMVALRQGRVTQARDLAEQCVAANPGAVDGWRTLARAQAALGQPRLAVRACDRALGLALRGVAPIGGPWLSNPERRLVDPEHWADHAAAAELHAVLGDQAAAAAHRRIAEAGCAER